MGIESLFIDQLSESSGVIKTDKDVIFLFQTFLLCDRFSKYLYEKDMAKIIQVSSDMIT